MPYEQSKGYGITTADNGRIAATKRVHCFIQVPYISKFEQHVTLELCEDRIEKERPMVNKLAWFLKLNSSVIGISISISINISISMISILNKSIHVITLYSCSLQCKLQKQKTAYFLLKASLNRSFVSQVYMLYYTLIQEAFVKALECKAHVTPCGTRVCDQPVSLDKPCESLGPRLVMQQLPTTSKVENSSVSCERSLFRALSRRSSTIMWD